MSNVGSLDAQLRLDISNFAAGIKEATALTYSLRSSLNEAMGAGSGFYDLAGDMEAIGEDIKTLASLVQNFNAEINQAGKLDGFVQVQQHTAGLTENLRQSAFALDNIRKQLINIEPRMGRVAQLSKQIAPGAVSEFQMENLVQAGLGDLLLMSSGEELVTVSEKVKQIGKDVATVSAEVKEVVTQTSTADDKVDDWTQNANMAKEAAKDWAASTREVAEESRRAAQEASKTVKPQQTGIGFTWPSLKDSRIWKGMEKNASKYRRDVFKAAAYQEKNRLASKDIKRIIGGIVISQVFYKLLDVMSQLVTSSIEFANNMDQAEIAFKYLLKDGDKANVMVRQLQDFSIASPLQTDDVMNATRQLMAMGFEAKEIIPTLSIMADTASVFTSSAGGMAEMISGITLAIGQMRSSGKVMTQEMRQLYNAGVPVFEIMREELNLTAEEVRNIGKMNIDSELGVNALLRGLQKRYAGAAEEFTKTIPGALEVIQKNFRLIFTELSEEPRAGLSEWLNKVANKFKAFTAITRAYGPGGLMQALFPPHLHEPIRRLIGAFQQLGNTLVIVGKILRDIFGGALTHIIRILGFILPYITTFIHGLAQMLQWIYTTIPWIRQLAQAFAALLIVVAVVKAIKGLYNLLRIGKIIKWFVSGIGTLVKAFSAWATSASVAAASNLKLMATLLAVIAVIALIVGKSNRARDSLSKLWNSFKNIGVGFDSADILQPDFKKQVDVDWADDLEQLPPLFEDIEDTASGADKAIKKMFNQSFDEVFLIDPLDDMGFGGLDEIDFGGINSQLEDLVANMEQLKLSGDFWDDWANIADNFDLDLSSVLDSMKDAAAEFWETLKEFFSTPEGWLLATGALVTSALIAALKGGVEGFQKFISTFAIVAGALSVIWSLNNVLEEGLNFKNLFIGFLGSIMLGAGLGWKATGTLAGTAGYATIFAGLTLVIAGMASIAHEGNLGIKEALLTVVGSAVLGAGFSWITGTTGAAMRGIIGISVGLSLAISSVVASYNGDGSLATKIIGTLGAALAGWLAGSAIAVRTGVAAATGGAVGLIIVVGVTLALQLMGTTWSQNKQALEGVTTASSDFEEALSRAEEASRDLKIAQDELKAAIEHVDTVMGQAVSVIDAYERAQSRAKNTAQALTEAEKYSRLSGKQLFDLVMDGTLTYDQMTTAQKKTYRAYLDNADAQADLTKKQEEANAISELVIDANERKKSAIGTLIEKVRENALATKEARERNQDLITAQQDLSASTGKLDDTTVLLRQSMLAAWRDGQISTEQAVQIMSNLMNGLGEDAKEVFVDSLPEDIKAGLATTQYEPPSNILRTFFQNVGKDIATNFNVFFGNPLGLKNGTSTTFESHGKSIGTGLSKGITASDALSAAQTLSNKLKQVFTRSWGINSPSTVSYGYGISIAQGLKNGVNGQNLGTWFSNVATSMKNSFAHIMQIKSPSRIMEGFGEYMAEGLMKGAEGILGISDYFKVLLDSLDTWLKPIEQKIHNWWEDIWVGLQIKLNAEVALHSSTPMSGLSTADISSFSARAPMAATTPQQDSASMANQIAVDVIQTLAPMLVGTQEEVLPPMYVGTLVADERGLKELERRLRVIGAKEGKRGG